MERMEDNDCLTIIDTLLVGIKTLTKVTITLESFFSEISKFINPVVLSQSPSAHNLKIENKHHMDPTN